MTTQIELTAPTRIDPETMKRFIAEGLRQRSLVFHAFFCKIFSSRPKPAISEIPANAVCCGQ